MLTGEHYIPFFCALKNWLVLSFLVITYDNKLDIYASIKYYINQSNHYNVFNKTLAFRITITFPHDPFPLVNL